MSDTSVGGVGRRHFSPEDEEMLRRSESTNDVVKRDTGSKVGINGSDLTQKQLEHEQKAHMGGHGWTEAGHAAYEALGGAEAEIFAGMTAGAGVIAGALLGFGGALHTLSETEKQRDEQGDCMTRMAMHAAVIGKLDLPDSFKNLRIEGDLAEADMGSMKSDAFKMAEQLGRDPKGLAVLQQRADAGMDAARDMVEAGVTDKAAFLKANPRIAELYAKDAAFHEGFDAYVYVKDGPDRAVLDQRLDARDARATQPRVQVRG